MRVHSVELVLPITLSLGVINEPTQKPHKFTDVCQWEVLFLFSSPVVSQCREVWCDVCQGSGLHSDYVYLGESLKSVSCIHFISPF